MVSCPASAVDHAGLCHGRILPEANGNAGKIPPSDGRKRVLEDLGLLLFGVNVLAEAQALEAGEVVWEKNEGVVPPELNTKKLNERRKRKRKCCLP